MNPIPLDHVPALIILLKPALAEIRRAGITFDNIEEKAGELALIITKHAPGAVALLSGINIHDLRALPVKNFIDIAGDAVNTNVAAAVSFGKHAPEIIDNGERILSWFTELYNA